MEAPVFAEGPEPPDFSLLRELLFPPCLEPDPSCGQEEEARRGCSADVAAGEERAHRAGPGHAAAVRGCAESRSRAKGRSPSPRACGARAGRQGQQQRVRGTKWRGGERRSALDQRAAMDPLRNFLLPVDSMSCSLQAPAPNVLFFLQESAKLLPKPELDGEVPRAVGRSMPSSSAASGSHMFKIEYPRLPTCSKLTCSWPLQSHPQACSFLPTFHVFSPMDALNLISIQCTNLVNAGSLVGTNSRMNTIKAMQVGDPSAVVEIPESGPKLDLIEKCMLHHNHIGASSEGMRSTPGAVALQNKDGMIVPSNMRVSSVGCAKIPRKQKRPTKSAVAWDPAFEGVWFQMRLRFGEGDYGDCHLLTTFHYSVRCWKRMHRPKPSQIRSTNDAVRVHGSEEDRGAFFGQRNKCCASCRTEKTPLWRDAEDGTPLCNACGIRYKKYGIRCCKCWNIPKKEGKVCTKCSSCGGRLNVTLAKRKAGK